MERFPTWAPWVWARWYLQGMREYGELNARTPAGQTRALRNEWVELWSAMSQGDARGIWEEVCDVCHAGILLVVVSLTVHLQPRSAARVQRWLGWIPLLVLPTAAKIANRVRATGCVRSSQHCLKPGGPDHCCGRREYGKGKGQQGELE